jgi:glycosyltransferase involved in cell wall biosynthesis|tara:strand:- start:1259 stop:2386 length:1128 start_codon:yes stop_codon:yes gene_type:complete
MFTKRKLKIFVDGYLLNKEYQGTKTYIIELYKEFAQENRDVLIYIGCFNSLKVEEYFFGIPNIKFIYFKSQSRISRMFFEIPKIIKKNKFDFAHFQYVIPFFKLKTCKYIVTIHDILFNDFSEYFSLFYRLKRNFLFKQSAKKSDILITVSEYSKRRIQKVYKTKKKEIFITPNGVSNVFLKEYIKEDSIKYVFSKYKVKSYLLYVSRIEPRKNQQAIIKVFSELENSDLNVVFIGSKTLENNILNKEYQKLSSNLKKRIYFFNAINEVDLVEFYRAAKVFVYPSFAEGFGIPPLEAAALKIPVISANNTALEDFSFFKPYHIDISDLVLFKSKLIDILESNNRHNLINIKNKIKEKYTWEQSSKEFLRILNIYK